MGFTVHFSRITIIENTKALKKCLDTSFSWDACYLFKKDLDCTAGLIKQQYDLEIIYLSML